MVMEIVVSAILLILGIVVLVTIHVCIVGRAFGEDYENGSSTTSVVQRIANRCPSMAQEDIKNLPCFDYKVEEERGNNNNNNNDSTAECAVCLESFKVGDICRLLPNCKHSFHAQCIDSWLLKTAACPICRTFANSPEIGEANSNSGGVGVELV